jgi:hypothetical protein
MKIVFSNFKYIYLVLPGVEVITLPMYVIFLDNVYNIPPSSALYSTDIDTGQPYTDIQLWSVKVAIIMKLHLDPENII